MNQANWNFNSAGKDGLHHISGIVAQGAFVKRCLFIGHIVVQRIPNQITVFFRQILQPLLAALLL